MKILLSAYACEPNKGSEPGVGWSWCTELAKFHDVWVITRDNNEPTITKYLSENPECKNDRLHFIYVGLSKKFTFWKKGRRGMRLFYDLWQRKAVKVAKKYHDHIHFDIVQHVTFVSYTQPTYMFKLKIPMIWGPVSGGENIPVEIKLNLSIKEKIIENIRKLSQKLAVIYPCIRKTMRDSKLIIVATEETKMKIPSKYWSKTMLVPAIGVGKIPDIEIHKRVDDKIKIVMAGRLIYWKAFDIGIKAFLKIADEHPEASLHIRNLALSIVGEGDYSGKAAGTELRFDWWYKIWKDNTSSVVRFLFGRGFGMALTDFVSAGSTLVREPHNSFISVFARQGILGVFLWCFLLFKIFRMSIHRLSFDICSYLVFVIFFLFITVSLVEPIFEASYAAIPIYSFAGIYLALKNDCEHTN